MKKIFIFITCEVLPLAIFFVMAMAISLWLTNILFSNSAWFNSRLHVPLSTDNPLSLSFWFGAMFSGEGFIYMVWGILFLPLFIVATKLLDKNVSVKLYSLFNQPQH